MPADLGRQGGQHGDKRGVVYCIIAHKGLLLCPDAAKRGRREVYTMHACKEKGADSRDSLVRAPDPVDVMERERGVDG